MEERVVEAIMNVGESFVYHIIFADTLQKLFPYQFKQRHIAGIAEI